MRFHAHFQDFLRSVIDRICAARAVNCFGLFAAAPPSLGPSGSSVGGRGGIARLPWARDLTHTDHATRRVDPATWEERDMFLKATRDAGTEQLRLRYT